jgi:hypothetical protein
MSASILSLRIDSPLRPPDWRWELAKRLVRANKRCNRNLDPWCHKAYRLAEAAQRYDRGDDWALLDWANKAKDPEAKAMIDCWEIFEKGQPDANHRTKRHELEARIVAKQSFDDIAHIMKLDKSVIQCYEPLFFHVLDRVDSKSWVGHNVLGPAYHTRLSENDYATMWKVMALNGGSFVLDEFVHKSGMGLATTPADAIAEIGRDRDRLRLLKSATATRTMAVNGFTQIPILEYDLRARTEEVKLGQGNVNQTANDISSILTVVSWGVAQDRNHKKIEPRVVIPDGMVPVENPIDWETVNPFERTSPTTALLGPANEQSAADEREVPPASGQDG